MTRRIRDFMNSANNVDLAPTNDEFNPSPNSNEFNINRNFGIALSKCEPSSISCVSIAALFTILMKFLKIIF